MVYHIPRGYLKFSGWTLLIGGGLGVMGQLFHGGDTPKTIADVPSFLDLAVNLHVMLAWSSILILLGMPAIFLRQANQLKWWGWIGFPLLFIGMILEIFHGPVQIIAYPIIYADVTEATLATINGRVLNPDMNAFPLGLLIFIPLMPGIFLGLLLTGIATLQAKVLPKASGWFTIAIFIILAAGMFLPENIPFFAAIHFVFVMFGALLAFRGETLTTSESARLAGW